MIKHSIKEDAEKQVNLTETRPASRVAWEQYVRCLGLAKFAPENGAGQSKTHATPFPTAKFKFKT